MRRMVDVIDQLRDDIDQGKIYVRDGDWKYRTQRFRKVPEEVGYVLDHYLVKKKILINTDGKVQWSPK